MPRCRCAATSSGTGEESAMNANFVDSDMLRASFAASLSDLYGTEVPAYTKLLQVCHEVNRRVVARDGEAAERLGSIDRVTAERHGAIRVGGPEELAQVARIFGALGMQPTGFYDLRDAHPQPIPVVSTAFRPTERDDLARNPFRVFTSILVPEDRRFFDPDLEARLKNFNRSRQLFSPDLLKLADRAEAERGLGTADADRFLALATASFALSSEPVDRAWYTELEKVSGVAADIGGVGGTHINHLTPRVLDIDDLYASMTAHGIEMIDKIQGPPRWEGPDVLLRQTSFRAQAEPRRYREADGSIVEGTMRVRFGEVEARGIALTSLGRDQYDRAVAEIEQGNDPAAAVWGRFIPGTEKELHDQGLAYFTYRVAEGRPVGLPPDAAAVELVAGGWLVPEPIAYEDFLPRSAAGIFASNLSNRGTLDVDQGGAERDIAWLSERIGRRVNVPEAIYAAQSRTSLEAAVQLLGSHETCEDSS